MRWHALYFDYERVSSSGNRFSSLESATAALVTQGKVMRRNVFGHNGVLDIVRSTRPWISTLRRKFSHQGHLLSLNLTLEP